MFMWFLPENTDEQIATHNLQFADCDIVAHSNSASDSAEPSGFK